LPAVKIIGGVLLFGIGWCYLYKPGWIVQFNAWCREILFDDGIVLLARRKIGMTSILLASLMLYSGFQGLNALLSMGPRIERELLLEAQQAFQAKRYEGAIKRCQILIREKPENIDAWLLLGSSWLAVGKKDEAKIAWGRVLTLDPKNAVGNSRLIQESEVAGSKK